MPVQGKKSRKKPNQKRLDGRIALVTGASRGIGAACASVLGGAGAGVIVHYAENRKAAEAVTAGLGEGRCHLVRADLAEPGAGRALWDQALQWRQRIDVLVTNATLQWLTDPLDLLPAMVGRVAPGGFLAIGVPANFDEPSHVLRRELAAEAPYAAHTAGVASPWSPGAMAYLEALTDLGCEVDAWETTYLHVLEGEDAVFEWISGTRARPTLQALPAGLREEFAGELRRRLRAAYPPRDGRVVLPFRRAFAVARVPA